MTGMHTRLKRADFKSKLEAGDDVGREKTSGTLFKLRDLALHQLEMLVELILDLVGRSVPPVRLVLLHQAFADVDERSVSGRRRSEVVQLSARPRGRQRPVFGRNAMKWAIKSASIRSVLAKVPRRLPKASVCAGGSSRAGIPAATSKFAQSLHSWPPAALKQTRAVLSPEISARCEWPSSVFGRRSWQPSARQWMSSPVAREVRTNDLWMC